MKCELCGKRLEFADYDPAEGIVWFKCPGFDDGSDEHSAPGVNVNLRDVASKNICNYLTAEFGKCLVVDFSGNVYFRDSSTYSEDEIAVVKCPGIGNLDSTYFTEEFVEWDGELGAYVIISPQEDVGRVVGDLTDVIQECCDTGDVMNFIDELEIALIKNL